MYETVPMNQQKTHKRWVKKLKESPLAAGINTELRLKQTRQDKCVFNDGWGKFSVPATKYYMFWYQTLRNITL